ncbi:MAG TPA: hypothetical protein DCP63_02845 [Bacteroidetes bacterium]|nr:hypothetical protein [Bacteroidota bacterium]
MHSGRKRGAASDIVQPPLGTLLPLKHLKRSPLVLLDAMAFLTLVIRKSRFRLEPVREPMRERNGSHELKFLNPRVQGGAGQVRKHLVSKAPVDGPV